MRAYFRYLLKIFLKIFSKMNWTIPLDFAFAGSEIG